MAQVYATFANNGLKIPLVAVTRIVDAEGSVLAAREFAAHVIDRVVTSEPVQAAGAAVLRLAWRHRDTLTVLPRALSHAC